MRGIPWPPLSNSPHIFLGYPFHFEILSSPFLRYFRGKGIPITKLRARKCRYKKGCGGKHWKIHFISKASDMSNFSLLWIIFSLKMITSKLNWELYYLDFFMLGKMEKNSLQLYWKNHNSLKKTCTILRSKETRKE